MKIRKTMPPKIIRMFNPKLLSMFPAFSCSRLEEELEYIKWLMNKKTRSGRYRKMRIIADRMIANLEKTYEWIKAKEKELEGQKAHRTQEPFYSPGCACEKDRAIRRGFEFKRIPGRRAFAWDGKTY
jgi:hypothetical protein